MRLIDADALKKKAVLLAGENDPVYAVPESEIDNQPTAYDVEAVVEGVTDVAEILKKDLYVEKFCQPKMKSGECATMGCTKCLTDEIIRIVKAGGNNG